MKSNDMSMQGGGYYNDHSALQGLAIDKALSLLEPPQFKGKTIILADYGSSEGKNAVRLFVNYLSSLRGISSATLVFNDTAFNDYSSLSKIIDTNWSSLSQDGRLSISPLMAPRSFYGQVLPDDFVDAGFSFTALHWLQHMPSSFEPSDLSRSAHEDLVSFLAARHKEIRPNGALTLFIPCHAQIGVGPGLACLQASVRRLASAYHVDPSFTLRLPVYWRTMEEILASINVEQHTWTVKSHVTIPMMHPSRTSAVLDPANMEARARYAATIAGFVTAACARFIMDDTGTYPKKREQNGPALQSAVVAETTFLEDLLDCFKDEWLRSFVTEEIGLTYAFVQLERL
ncbi:benzoate carboxyl methyltransferase [Fusarium tjaetaba]|uniref:Benzoate carboxyl methyltransferase n=1 Tax=Fusarium tjaetaba TaxID=1567544 RepID=A0A8H5VIG5_9HYPO|nr:benzoate carboxyl methyltransferase [Fusarium tjaetaba]KAF5624631.1 benzoate carboxyl methyltransferase [Fusarium tjaetaba]